MGSLHTAPPVLYGGRCTNPDHPEVGTVYGRSLDRDQIVSLARNTCYEVVRSTDGGNTWTAVES